MKKQEWTVYNGDDLGACYHKSGTTFRLWSPMSQEVTLRLYKNGADDKPYSYMQMGKEEFGVWVLYVPDDLHGVYYDFEVASNGKKAVGGDPYAKACGVNGMRSMVVNMLATNPTDWMGDKPPVQAPEDVIYELHVKEFSHDPSGGFTAAYRGKYMAFTEAHTTLNGDSIHPTGLDYLKNLGVTHIQLMPVFDFGSVDESLMHDSFNWGYDPVNYNVPEGSYATDPFDGAVRIREFKEMIKSLHKEGFRVIMDVVYNHTHAADSHLERTASGYFYRREKDGTLCNGSGCGNDIASERPMCSKYILQSVLYWAQEYHIDGFRFDLMGLLDVDLMNAIRDKLDAQFGKGEKLIFGEPWAAGESAMAQSSVPALRNNINKLDVEVGVFCDSTRDAVKGHVFAEKATGFVNGGKNFEQAILHSVSAWCKDGAENPAKAPSQIITYVSAHDNLTLWDKLVISMMTNPDFAMGNEDIIRANKLAAAIYLMCQGRIFMLSGEEFARTKGGLENSYQDPIEVNRLDWNRMLKYHELVKYYRGLIALRRVIPALCDKSAEAHTAIGCETIEAYGCVSFLVDNNRYLQDTRWGRVFFVYNATDEAINIELPKGNWEVLVDSESSDYWQGKCRKISEDSLVKACSVGIFGEV